MYWTPCKYRLLCAQVGPLWVASDGIPTCPHKKRYLLGAITQTQDAGNWSWWRLYSVAGTLLGPTLSTFDSCLWFLLQMAFSMPWRTWLLAILFFPLPLAAILPAMKEDFFLFGSSWKTIWSYVHWINLGHYFSQNQLPSQQDGVIWQVRSRAHIHPCH